MVKMTCKVRIGLYRQKVLIEGRNAKGKLPIEAYWMPLEEIPKFIVNQKDVTKVFLVGPEDYTSTIENKYNELISTKRNYTNNKEFIYWQE